MTPRESAPALDRVARINQELADVFARPPVDLPSGSVVRRGDDLIVCGVLGGKDAGKTTLINAIAGEEVSRDLAVVGEGTSRPTAYVHHDDAGDFRRRFEAPAAGSPRPVHLVAHRVDAVRGLVLVDLPDIDSTFRQHLETVRSAVERLDRVIWLFDPKKGDDQALADLLPHVVRDPASVYCVLNKVDQLLKDGIDADGAEAFWHTRLTWFIGCLESVGLRADEPKRFLVSARFPTTDAFARATAGLWWGDANRPLAGRDRPLVQDLATRATREIDRLRAELRRPLTAAEVSHIKQGNESAELAAAVAELLRRYDAEPTAARLDEILADLGRQYDREFGADYLLTVSNRLARSGASDLDLARSLTARRVERWPLLPVIYWPLSGVIHWLGSRLADGGPARPRWSPDDLPRVAGRGLRHRAEVLVEHVRKRCGELPNGLLPAERLPAGPLLAARAEARLAERMEHLDADLIASCQARWFPPGRIARAAVWFILLWFPLLQPLAKGGIELAIARSLTDGLHAALTLVVAAGAGSLFKGLAAVGCFYLIMLAAIFSRSVRDVRRERQGGIDASADPALYNAEVERLLAEEIHVPLREPLANRLSRIRRALRELQEIRQALP